MPRVLVVDDEQSIRKLLRSNLSAHGYEVDEAEDGAAALDQIAQQSPDLVLLDTMMPGVDGFEVLEQLRSVSRFRNLPVIMLTAKTSEEDRVRAFTAGASDFVPKPFYVGELLARVQKEIKTAQRQRQLVAMSTTDPLTGLFNYRYLDSRLRHTFPASETNPVCGLLFELTGLESVARKLGHKAANDILGSAGDIINAWVTDDDQAFALGGPQMLVLSVSDEESSLERGAELQKEIHQVCHFTPGGQVITVHLAFVVSEDGETLDSFFYRLESALRDARGGGEIESADAVVFGEESAGFPSQQLSSETAGGEAGAEAEVPEPLGFNLEDFEAGEAPKETLELAAAPGIGPQVSVPSQDSGPVEAIAPPAAAAFGEPAAAAEPPPVAAALPGAVEQTSPPVQPSPEQIPRVPAAMEGSAWQKAASMELDASALPDMPDADELFAQTLAGARERGEEEPEQPGGGDKPRRRTNRQTLSMRMLSREFSGLRDLGKS